MSLIPQREWFWLFSRSIAIKKKAFSGTKAKHSSSLCIISGWMCYSPWHPQQLMYVEHKCPDLLIYGCLRGRTHTQSKVSEPHKGGQISPNGIIWPLLLSTTGSGLEETSFILKLISDAPKEQILWERKRWCTKLHQIVRLPRNDHWKSVLPTVWLLRFRPGSFVQRPDISPQAWLPSPLLIEAVVRDSGCFSFKLPVPRWGFGPPARWGNKFQCGKKIADLFTRV